MPTVRTLIADSTDIALSGIRSILKNSPDIEVTDTALTAREALDKVLLRQTDLCLVSDKLEGLSIVDFMQKLNSRSKPVKVVLLTDAVDIPHLNLALKAGVSGYLVKTIGRKELIESLVDAARGEKVFSQSIARMMTERYVDRACSPGEKSPADHVTKREAEILHLIVDGYTSTEIARLLYISPRTVETHRSNLLQKLKIKNTAGLVRYALEKGPLTLP